MILLFSYNALGSGAKFSIGRIPVIYYIGNQSLTKKESSNNYLDSAISG